MNTAQFFQRFRDDQEIGRDHTDATLEVYFDNGTDVGRIVEHRPTTRCQSEILTPDNAAVARHWFERLRTQKGGRSHQEVERE